MRSQPLSLQLRSKGTCLHVWNNWHFGKYHQAENGNGGGYRTPPWKSLKYPQLLQCDSQKEYLLNLKFLCGKLHEAAGINKNSTPTEKQLIEHFTSPAIEALWEGMCATAKGKVRRISQNNWETTARTLRVQMKAREKGEPALKSSAGCKKKRRTPSTSPPPKRARSVANLEGDEVVIVAVSPDSRKTWKKGKGVCRVSMQGAAWEVPGPDKSDEDCGRIRLDVGDRDLLHHQGCNLSGSTTSAFHNLVCNHYYEQGVRCTESEFVPDLSTLIAKDGKYKGWNEYLSVLYIRESGSRNVEWDSAKVILENGLVIDRTRKGNPLAVYADSLCTFYRSKEYESPIENLKALLADTPLQLQNDDENWTWIEAEVPRQGFCTNDCGVVASCFALLYVHGLEKRGLLTENEVENVAPARSVKLRIPPTQDMSAFGILGRRYMSQSMRVAKLDFSSSLFDAEVLWNSDIQIH